MQIESTIRSAFKPLKTLGYISVGLSVATFLSGMLVPVLVVLSFASGRRGGAPAVFGSIALASLGLYAILLLSYVVVFMIWIHRAYQNLETFNVQHLQFSPNWAIGVWFVPILNLFRPLQVINEIFNGSNPDYLPDGDFNISDTTSPLLHLIWWGARLLSNFLFQLGSFAQTPQLFLLAIPLAIVGEILIIVVILRISRRQHQGAAKLTEQRLPPPPPKFN